MRSKALVLGIVTILAASACETPESTMTGPELSPDFGTGGLDQTNRVEVDARLLDFMAGVNARLEADGAEYRAEVAEWLGGDEVGNTVFFTNRGNKQLGDDFVPDDPRRGWSAGAGGAGDDITWAVDQTGDAIPPLGSLTAAETTDAISRAMGTWDAQSCSSLPLTQNSDFGIDIGVIAFENGLGGSPFVFADVQHAGWGDIDFFGGVIGATFTFIFVDGAGPTDIDGNGKLDVAFREIYYDPSWTWAIDGDIDVETVALHEVGHGLSQAHFGELFRTDKNGKFHFAPRAVMNAGYSGVQQTLLGTDKGGHCSNWGSWPNN